MKKIITDLLLILAGGCILMIISFYNRYPLVYSDTGTYLDSGFDKFIPFDRPIAYGLFLSFFSLRSSLWLVVIVQNIITSFVIFEICRLFIKAGKLPASFLGIMLFLTVFTGIGWYSNQIMADFFAPVFILLIFILYFSPIISIPKLLICCLLLVYALIVHFSHIVIAPFLVLGLFAIEYLFSKKDLFNLQNRNLQRYLLVLGVVSSAWIILPSVNYLIEKKFLISQGSHAFLMAHLADAGILERFLDKKCDSEEYKNCSLCNYKDSLPRSLSSFLWESNGVFTKTGGWIDTKDEYNKIIFGTIKDPEYLALNISKSFTYGCIQLTRNEIGPGLYAYTSGSPPYGQIHWRFHHELENYLNSRQNSMNGLNLKTLNVFNLIIILTSLLGVLFLLLSPLRKQLNILSLKFLVFTFLAIIINAFLTAGLNAPCERFHVRVVWLLPFSLLVILVTNFYVLKKAIANKLNKP